MDLQFLEKDKVPPNEGGKGIFMFNENSLARNLIEEFSQWLDLKKRFCGLL